MNVNNIIKVRDCSGSIVVANGNLSPEYRGKCLTSRRLRVLAVGGSYPTTPDVITSEPRVYQNDIMASDINDPYFIVFTQERFCRVVTRATPEHVVEITIPHGTRTFIVKLKD